MNKLALKAVSAVTGMTMLLSGCMYDGAVSPVRERSYRPGVGEREGLAVSRILTSPMNMLGHTYGEFGRWKENGYGLATPLLPAVTIPSGCLAACMDMVTGVGELISFQQFKSVSYPWESFDKAKSEPWATGVIVTYAVACVVLCAWAEAEEAKKHRPPPPPPGGNPPPPPPPPR